MKQSTHTGAEDSIGAGLTPQRAARTQGHGQERPSRSLSHAPAAAPEASSHHESTQLAIRDLDSGRMVPFELVRRQFTSS